MRAPFRPRAVYHSPRPVFSSPKLRTSEVLAVRQRIGSNDPSPVSCIEGGESGRAFGPAPCPGGALDECFISGPAVHGNPRQILRARPFLRIWHGLHPAPPPAPRTPATSPAPALCAARRIRSRARRAAGSDGSNPSGDSPRAPAIPRRTPGWEMAGARPRPAAPRFPRPEYRGASYGLRGPARRRRASQAGTPPRLAPVPLHTGDSWTESPALNARLSPRARARGLPALDGPCAR